MSYLEGLCELYKSGVWECILQKLEVVNCRDSIFIPLV